MKRISIFLIKVHRTYPLLLGFVIGIVVFSKTGDVQKMVTPFDIDAFVAVIFFVGILFLQLIAFMKFYSGENTVTKDITVRQGIIVRDKYFPIKINTELMKLKRIIGYFYAILTPVIYIELGYLLSVLVCLLSYR